MKPLVFCIILGNLLFSTDQVLMPPDINSYIFHHITQDPQVFDNPARCWMLIWCIDKLFTELNDFHKQYIFLFTEAIAQKLIENKGYYKSGIITGYHVTKHLSNRCITLIKNILAHHCEPLRLKSNLYTPYLFRAQEKTKFSPDKRLDLSSPMFSELFSLIKHAAKRSPEISQEELYWKQKITYHPQACVNMRDARYIWAFSTQEVTMIDVLAAYNDLFFAENPFDNAFYLFNRNPDIINTYTQFYQYLYSQVSKGSRLLHSQTCKKKYKTNLNNLRALVSLPALSDPCNACAIL